MRHPLVRVCLFLVVLAVPLYWVYQAWLFALGPDPGKVLVDRLGLGALVLLLITLSMAPLQKLTGWPGWIVVRRQLGLWSFAYVFLHLAGYLIFMLALDWGQLGIELRKRPYIIVGALAFLCLLLMAATSNRYSQRKLGRRWKKLHCLAYVVLGLGLLHFLWIVRADFKEWSIYAGVGAMLLLLRFPPVSRRLVALKIRSPNKTLLSP